MQSSHDSSVTVISSSDIARQYLIYDIYTQTTVWHENFTIIKYDLFNLLREKVTDFEI